jgi:hypothetical protein
MKELSKPALLRVLLIPKQERGRLVGNRENTAIMLGQHEEDYPKRYS